MRQNRIFCIAVSEILCRKTRFFLSVLLIGLSLLAIGFYYMFSNESQFHRNECDRALTKGIDGTGAMQVFGAYEDQRKLKKEAMDSGMIKAIGTWLPLFSSNELPEELTGQMQANGVVPLKETALYYIDRSVMEVHNLRYEQQKEIPEEKWKDPEWHGIILGADYRGIPLGSVHELEIFDGTVLKCEVIGILSKGEQIVSNLVMADGRGNGIYTMENLDGAIIMPEELYVSDRPKGSCNWAYIPVENVSLREAGTFLEEKAEEIGLTVEIAYLHDGFEAEEIDQRDTRRIDQEAYIVLCVISLMIGSCLQFMQVMEERKKLGILYANGFSVVDIVGIYAWQGILQIFIAFGLAWAGLKKIAVGYFDVPMMQGSVIKSLNRWIHLMALPRMAGYGMIMLAVCILIPVFMIRKQCPAELLMDTRG